MKLEACGILKLDLSLLAGCDHRVPEAGSLHIHLPYLMSLMKKQLPFQSALQS